MCGCCVQVLILLGSGNEPEEAESAANADRPAIPQSLGKPTDAPCDICFLIPFINAAEIHHLSTRNKSQPQKKRKAEESKADASPLDYGKLSGGNNGAGSGVSHAEAIDIDSPSFVQKLGWSSSEAVAPVPSGRRPVDAPDKQRKKQRKGGPGGGGGAGGGGHKKGGAGGGGKQ